ncbi:MAG: helix-turn-helix transcriptional regulator [Solirubrobacteraceae bacterium]
MSFASVSATRVALRESQVLMDASGEISWAGQRLVGRRRELQAIEHVIDRVLGGRTAGLALIGGSGIGKTALISEGARVAESRGMLVISGRCTEFESDVPYRLVIDTLDAVLAARGATWFRRLADDHLAELAMVHPSLRQFGVSRAPALQSERHRVHSAVRAVFNELAQDQPLMVVHDDVHWADPESVEALAHALRTGIDGPALALLAFRPHRASDVLTDNLEEAMQAGSLTMLQIPPLSETESDLLLGAGLQPRTREALYRDSGGNPFYLLQLARARRSGATPATDEAHDGSNHAGQIPIAVRAAIRQEVGSLGRDPTVLLEAAAVVGEPFDLRLAARVAELNPAHAGAAVDELVRWDFVSTTAVSGHYRFRHPIVRQTVYQSTRPGSTLAAHRRAAEALEEQGAPLSALAHHVERSARPGDRNAAELLARAAHEARRLAPSAAARWLRAALRILPQDTSNEHRLGLLVPLATALGSVGRVEESREALIDALPLLSEGQEVLKARLVGAIARLDHMIAPHREPSALLQHAIAALDPTPSAGTAALRLELALDCWFSGHLGPLGDAASAARRDAMATGEHLTYANALALEAIGRGHGGDVQLASQLVAQAAAIIDSLSDDDLAQRVEGMVVLGHAEFGAVDHAVEGARHLKRGVAIARGTGQDAWFVALLCSLCMANLLLGRIESGATAADEALEAARLGHRQQRIWALSLGCWAYRLRGELSAAIRLGEAAIKAAKQCGAGPIDWLAFCCLAVALTEAGDPARARDLILVHGGGPDLRLLPNAWRPVGYEHLTLGAVRLGDLDGAERWAKRAAAAAARYPTQSRIAKARYARAELALAMERPADCGQLALTAAQEFDSANWAIDAARARALAGRAMAASDHSGRAIDLLRRAHGELSASGANRYRDELALELRRLGEHVARPGTRGGGPGVGSLSGREREVAELVSRGMTNGQIAEELFLSVKTVESHLSHAYEKLGINSRALLAREIASTDSDDQIEAS